jgi:hypothetical protein
MRTLHLTLKKAPFEVMVTGEKDFEIRELTGWIMSRLFDSNGNEKHYDAIKFTNGYGKDKPYFVTEYRGCEFTDCMNRIFSNGFHLAFCNTRIKINLGEIIERGNLK